VGVLREQVRIVGGALTLAWREGGSPQAELQDGV